MNRAMSRWLNLQPLPVFEEDKGGTGGGAGDKGGDKGAGDDKGAGGDKSFAGGGGDGDKGGEGDKGGAKTLTEENWREFLAGDDTEILGELKRSKTSKDFLGRFKDLRTKASKSSLEDDPAPAADKVEELKAWRTKHNVPLEATDYKIPDPIKPKIRDQDKPIVDGYMAFMHAKNASQKEIDSGLEYYFQLEEATFADRAEADKSNKGELDKTMRSTWGADFRANSSIVARAAKELVPGVDWAEARMPNGTRLGDIPGVAEFLLEQGLAKWGEGAYEQGEGSGGNAVDDRLTELKGKMANRKEWNKHPEWATEYQTLIDRRNKRKGVGDEE